MASEEQEYKDALADLNLNEEEVKKKNEIGVVELKGANEKVLEVNKISFGFKMMLEGKMFSAEKGKFIQANHSLAGDHFIRLVYGQMQSFSEHANLISSKDIEKFYMQLWDAFKKVNNLILRDRTIKETDYRLIINSYKNAMHNIGDIITNNKGNMNSVFTKFEEQEKMERNSLID